MWRSKLGPDEFVEQVLHDLKQPLNHLRVVAQDLRLDAQKDRLDLEALPDSLREIEGAVDEAARRIDALRALDLAGGWESPPAQTLDLSRLSEEVLEEARGAFSEVSFSGELPAGVSVTVAWPSAVAHALRQLMRHACGAGAREVSVSLREEAGRALLELRSDEARRSLEVSTRLFEPIGEDRADDGGLGLAFACALVRGAGGDVGWERDGGPVVVLSLPLAAPEG